MLLLNPFSLGILRKSGIWRKIKHAALNVCIAKARDNSESKLTFSESSFNFLHGTGLHPLQPPVPLPVTRPAQRVNIQTQQI